MSFNLQDVLKHQLLQIIILCYRDCVQNRYFLLLITCLHLHNQMQAFV